MVHHLIMVLLGIFGAFIYCRFIFSSRWNTTTSAKDYFKKFGFAYSIPVIMLPSIGYFLCFPGRQNVQAYFPTYLLSLLVTIFAIFVLAAWLLFGELKSSKLISPRSIKARRRLLFKFFIKGYTEVEKEIKDLEQQIVTENQHIPLDVAQLYNYHVSQGTRIGKEFKFTSKLTPERLRQIYDVVGRGFNEKGSNL